ncbi:MAG TPA: hypothetical protein PLW14_03095 [Chlorobiota bacterium]|nr:hypothetical protein [Chlorobiota bacterium]
MTKLITLTEIGGDPLLINPVYIGAIKNCESEGRQFSEIIMTCQNAGQFCLRVKESIDVIKAEVFSMNQQELLAQSGVLRSIMPPDNGTGV